ncbi:hypothetical protein [Actinocatenispora comari]|uniref:Abortive infection protein n=1 Tax=Actinocatenispora comari TaxID=2807577 RepID=A0A8J4AIR5_9ACTN|nr:hypothetical protein [Actinocatenispora comari]GIL29418.1 hypothetical protein NUM_46720 [Actinocatenispora comari]
MRGKGINYDTGAYPAGHPTRERFDAATVGEEMRVIAADLHCTAVRITGGDPGRLDVAARAAAAAGLAVWYAPFPCELGTDAMLALFADCARRAESLRRQGNEVVLVLGGELSIMASGFLPGDDLHARLASLTSPGGRSPALLAAVPPALNGFLATALDRVRPLFGGPVTYASLPYERVDWTPFDYVAADAYRAAHNAATFAAEIRALHRYGKPVAVTEFGCATFRGAADLGARGWLIVDRSFTPPRLSGEYVRDEPEQARYLREVLAVFDAEGVDTAFWFTFAGYAFEHRPGPHADLDLASYGVVRIGPDGRRRPKAAFHALADAYRDRAVDHRPAPERPSR